MLSEANQAQPPLRNFAIPAAKSKSKTLATIWVMRTLAQGAVNVEQGENRNHQLTYTNVVRDLKRAGEWNGEAMKIAPLLLEQGKKIVDLSGDFRVRAAEIGELRLVVKRPRREST